MGRSWHRLLGAALAGAIAVPVLASDTSTDLNNRGVTEAKAGRFEAGAALLRQALQADPGDSLVRQNLSGVLTDWAGQLYQQGRLADAERLLQEAVGYQPDNGKALWALGDLAYFGRSDFDRAILFWKRASGAVPDDERRAIADRISQAQRDQAIERQFQSRRTTHFELRIPPGPPRATTDLETLLEAQYAQLAQDLGVTPPTLTVILYSDADLRRTYNQRDWALGFYDGRLRLLWSELGSEWGPAMVAHELAHAFLQHAYGHYLPIWIHEGFAQWREGARPRTAEEQELEARLVSGDAWVPLKWLDRRFTQPHSQDDVWRAYVQARLVVAGLIQRHGMDRFKQFLAGLRKGTAVEVAYDAAFAPARWTSTDRPMTGR